MPLSFHAPDESAPRVYLPESIAAKLDQLLGVVADPATQIVTSASACAQYLKDEATAGRPVTKALVLAEENVLTEVEAAGVDVAVYEPPAGLLYDPAEAAATIRPDPDINAVVRRTTPRSSLHLLHLSCIYRRYRRQQRYVYLHIFKTETEIWPLAFKSSAPKVSCFRLPWPGCRFLRQDVLPQPLIRGLVPSRKSGLPASRYQQGLPIQRGRWPPHAWRRCPPRCCRHRRQHRSDCGREAVVALAAKSPAAR